MIALLVSIDALGAASACQLRPFVTTRVTALTARKSDIVVCMHVET